MKEIGIKIVLVTGLLAAAAGLLVAESVDAYMAVPIAIDRTDGNKLNSTAIGGGLKFSTIEDYEPLGLGAGLTAYHPVAISWTQDSGASTTSVSDLYSAPVGLDLLLGVDINMLRRGFLSFPMSVGFHSKVDFYKPGAQINFGIGGSAAVRLNMYDFGIFVRAQVSYDFCGTWHADGKWSGGTVNQWGIQPQVGVSILD